MIDHLWDWPKVALYQEWERPKVGVYTLKYEGHDLEITKGPAHPGRKEKRYTIWIDGVPVAKAWSPGEAKPRAIRLVDRSHDGKPLVPLSGIDTTEQTPDTDGAVRASVALRDDLRNDLRNLMNLGLPPGLSIDTKEQTPDTVDQAAETPNINITRLERVRCELTRLDEAMKHLNHLPPPREATDRGLSPDLKILLDTNGPRVYRANSVSFTITGKLDLDPATALTTLTTTVELLRESGQVHCNVVLPPRITL